MLANNFKIGDVFEDGGRKYKITGKHELGYAISEAIGTSDVVAKVVEPLEKPEYSKTQINRMSTADLENLCEELGIDKGTGVEMKKAIIDKLEL